MAKGDVTLKFDAQTAAFVQNIMRAKDVLEQGAVSTRKFAEAGVKAGDSFESGMSKVASTVASASAGFLSLGAVVGAVKQTFDDHLTQMEKNTAGLKKHIDELHGAMASQGKIQYAPQIETRLAGMVNPEAGRATIDALYSRTSEAMGARADQDAIADAVQVAVKGMEAGRTESGAAILAKNYAEIVAQSKENGAFAGKSARQLQERAHLITTFVPEGLDDRAWRTIARSKDGDSVLNMIIASKKGKESAKILDSLIADADTDFTQGGIRDEQSAALASVPQDQRLAAMLANPEKYVKPEHRRAAENIRRNLRNFTQQADRGAGLEGQIKAREEIENTHPGSHAAKLLEVVNREADVAAQKNEVAATNESALYQFRVNREKAKGTSNWMAKMDATGMQFLDWISGGVDEYEMSQVEKAHGISPLRAPTPPSADQLASQGDFTGVLAAGGNVRQQAAAAKAAGVSGAEVVEMLREGAASLVKASRNWAKDFSVKPLPYGS